MNPEFRRYLWLELTTHRLIGMPCVLLVALWLVYVLSGWRLDSTVPHLALWSYALLALLWGTRLAGESVSAELVAGTWDGQRMSALGPWSMAWGKLAGSTVFVWYGCAILAAACLAATAVGGGDVVVTACRLAVVTAGAVIAHAVALLASLHGIGRRSREPPKRPGSAFMAGAVAAIPFFMLGNMAVEVPVGAVFAWYGRAIEPFALALALSLAFAVWSVTGVYRLMRVELQRRNGPWLWIAFTLFCALLAAGFVGDERLRIAGLVLVLSSELAARAMVGLAVSLGLVYAMALIEPKDPVEYRRLARLATAGRWREAGEVVPRWLIGYAIAAMFGLVTVVGAVGAGYGAVPFAGTVGFVGSLLAFAGRDIALLLLLNLAPGARRADAAGFFYLVVLYLLAPAILAVLDLGQLRALLLPDWRSGLLAVVPPLVQAAALAALVRWRWRRHYGAGARA